MGDFFVMSEELGQVGVKCLALLQIIKKTKKKKKNSTTIATIHWYNSPA